MYVPASTAVRCVGVHDDKAVLVGECLVRGTRVEGLSGAAAVMDGSEQARAGLKRVGDVGIDFHVGGIRSEVGDLRRDVSELLHKPTTINIPG